MPQDDRPPTGRAPRMLRLAPGALAFAVAGVVAIRYETPPADVARFALAVLWSILLPGILVLRLLRQRPTQLVTELALGGVVGLTVQLAAWAVYVAAGVGSWLGTYPLLLLVACAVSPWRQRVFRFGRYPATMTAGPAWVLGVAYAVSVWKLALAGYPGLPLPPRAGLWYQDLYWHLSISAEARHAFPPKVPQLGDEILRYHWFSNAHMAAESLVSGVDVLLVTARLWYLPIYALLTLTTYALTVHLSRRAWAGAAAAALLVIPVWVRPAAWIPGMAQQAYIDASPSHLFALPFTIVGVWLLVDATRGELDRRGWVLFALVLVGTSGAKSSALPVLLGGAAAALAVSAIRRTGRRQALAAFVLIGAILAVSVRYVVAANTGSTLALARVERALALAQQEVRAGADHATLTRLTATLAVLLLVEFLYVGLGAALLHRSTRSDPAVWVLVGVLGSAKLAMMVISHPGLSQMYFVRGVVPLAAVFSLWGFVILAERAAAVWPRRTLLLAAVTAALLGLVALRVAWAIAGRTAPTAGQTLSVVLPLAGIWIAVGLLVVGVILAAVVRRQSRTPQLVALAVGVAVLAMATIPPLPDNPVLKSHGPPQPISLPPTARLSPGEIAATTWMREHTPERDLMATNVYCTPTPTRAYCDARAYWVTGLSTRSAFLAGWAYEDQNLLNTTDKRHGVFRRAFWDPDRLALNEAAFRAPTRAVLDTLHRRGVRWLFADGAAAPVSPELGRLADRRFVSGQVSIYRLRAPAR